MKTDKEFLDGIYKKADEIRKEKKSNKIVYLRNFANIAAIFVIVFTLGIGVKYSIDNKKTIISDNESVQEISLNKVGDFSKLYNIVKENYTDNRVDVVYESNDASSIRNSSQTEQVVAVKNKDDDSSTNTQVEDVDEADIVKVYDDYIYYITKGNIVIIDARNASKSDVVSKIEFKNAEYVPLEMYVNNNKLIIIGTSYKDYSIYSNRRIFYSAQTDIRIYDITDKNEPKQVRNVLIDGRYNTSRMVENNLYITSNKSINTHDIYYTEENELDERDYIPCYNDSVNGKMIRYIGYDDIYYFDKIYDLSYLMIAGLNIDSDDEVNVKTFLGAGENIYSSKDNLYVATTLYEREKIYNNPYTHIMKFSLDNGKVNFKAEAEVDGYVNNQFSMDENNDYFRIATTSSSSKWLVNEKTSNNLFILDKDLKKIGSVTDFAEEEKIYSVRYMNNKAYVVTFKQTDPLFVIDLSNPRNPKILGELKIPGYSTYLHPYDETHIIGFGYDTKETSYGAITNNGLKMAMFDVSDLNNPKELFNIKIGNNSTSSEFAYNHKAMIFSKERNIIAFPISSYTKSGYISSALVYGIDLEKGFSIKGDITSTSVKYDQKIQRLVYVNNVYYALSNTLVKVVNMETFNTIKEIEL